MFLDISPIYPFDLKQPKNPLAYILVVDDNDIALKIRSCRLAKMGFNVDTASNGEEGVLKVEENLDKYDAILMNFKMPVYNGIQATNIITKRLGFKNPVIGFSAGLFLREDYYQAGKRAGMVACIDSEEIVVIRELIKWLFEEPEKKKLRERLNVKKSWKTKIKEFLKW